MYQCTKNTFCAMRHEMYVNMFVSVNASSAKLLCQQSVVSSSEVNNCLQCVKNLIFSNQFFNFGNFMMKWFVKMRKLLLQEA